MELTRRKMILVLQTVSSIIFEYNFILAAVDMSTYLSPMLTIMPPMMAGSTFFSTFTCWPFFVNRSNTCFKLCSWLASSGCAVVTVTSTSPRSALIMWSNVFTSFGSRPRRPFSVIAAKVLRVRGLNWYSLASCWSSWRFSCLETIGLFRVSATTKNQPINQSINQSINRPKDQTTKRSINRSINQSKDEFNKTISQYRSTRSINRSIERTNLQKD